ncbi:MAG: 4Fe-4S binding protein [Desulfuromonadales bacterium]|nr:4Fe-4S binding protein [Desulfuromonadales bacterium]
MPIDVKKPLFWRTLVQWGFLLWTAFLGVQFALFVRHFETGGATPLYVRPPGVEGFLPIGALVGLRHWLATGEIHPVHPAALVLFLTFVAMSLLACKSFCSWLCPVGTISEALGRLGQRLFGRTFHPWRWLDFTLRGVKYLLLAFFLKIIVLDLPTAAISAFLDAPYWAVSDIKMLRFFTRISPLAATVLALLAALSLLFRHFWCRYLCPYGALLGLLAMASPWRIRRRPETCNGCGTCSRSCPSSLPVDKKKGILSPECTGCLTCVNACPQPQALHMAPPWSRRHLPWWGFAVMVGILFAVGVGTGMATGHWQTVLGYDDYRFLVPLADRFGH